MLNRRRNVCSASHGWRDGKCEVSGNSGTASRNDSVISGSGRADNAASRLQCTYIRYRIRTARVGNRKSKSNRFSRIGNTICRKTAFRNDRRRSTRKNRHTSEANIGRYITAIDDHETRLRRARKPCPLASIDRVCAWSNRHRVSAWGTSTAINATRCIDGCQINGCSSGTQCDSAADRTFRSVRTRRVLKATNPC